MIGEEKPIIGIVQASTPSLVDANREGKGKGSYVSLHLMVGRYDSSLSWPFRGEVKLQIRNSCDNSDHIDFTIQCYNPFVRALVMKIRAGIPATIG